MVVLRKLLSLGLEVLGGFAVCLEKEKARELAVHATGSAGNQGQEGDAAVSVVQAILADLLLCGVLQNPVDLVGEAQLAVELWLEVGAVAVVGKPEVCNKGKGARGVSEVGDKFDVAPALLSTGFVCL